MKGASASDEAVRSLGSADFGNRTAVTVDEVAEKLRCSVDLVLDLIADGSFARPAGMHRKSARSTRIPIEVYRGFIRRSISADQALNPEAPLRDACLDFLADPMLTVPMIAVKLSISDDNVLDLIHDGSLVALNIKPTASKRAVYRVPIEAYRSLIRSRSAAAQ